MSSNLKRTKLFFFAIACFTLLALFVYTFKWSISEHVYRISTSHETHVHIQNLPINDKSIKESNWQSQTASFDNERKNEDNIIRIADDSKLTVSNVNKNVVAKVSVTKNIAHTQNETVKKDLEYQNKNKLNNSLTLHTNHKDELQNSNVLKPRTNVNIDSKSNKSTIYKDSLLTSTTTDVPKITINDLVDHPRIPDDNTKQTSLDNRLKVSDNQHKHNLSNHLQAAEVHNHDTNNAKLNGYTQELHEDSLSTATVQATNTSFHKLSSHNVTEKQLYKFSNTSETDEQGANLTHITNITSKETHIEHTVSFSNTDVPKDKLDSDNNIGKNVKDVDSESLNTPTTTNVGKVEILQNPLTETFPGISEVEQVEKKRQKALKLRKSMEEHGELESEPPEHRKRKTMSPGDRLKHRLRNIGVGGPLLDQFSRFGNNDFNHFQAGPKSNVTVRPDVCKNCFKNDFKILINNPKICSDSETDVFLLILISSAPRNVDARNAIRKTWGRVCNTKTSIIKCVFLLGETSERDLGIRTENKEYGDIIKHNYHDSYANLTYKTMTGLKWSHQFCPNAKYVMKTDDDMYINTELLPIMLQRAPSARFIGGFCWGPSSPHRDMSSKWYVSFQQYTRPFYPKMCSGTGYVMSSDVVSGILSRGKDVPFFYLEDVYVALCVNRQGIQPVTLVGFHNTLVEFDACSYRNRVMTSHSLSASSLEFIWKELNTCPRSDLTPNMLLYSHSIQ